MAGMADVIARLSVWLGIDTAAFEKGADISEKRLKKMEREFQKLGDRMQDIGKTMSVALTVPLTGASAAVVKFSGDFEAAMIKLGISSQATAGEMREMSELALKLGKDTTFGASEAATAMDELAKSGLSARDILDGAAEAAVSLASATGSELSPAANAITDTMKQFGLSTAQLPEAVNQITGAVNQSKLDFADYALAIGQAGGVAGGLGVEFTDFNTVLASTSALFASGSDAGTSFKTFLTSLSGNSKQAKQAIASFGLEFFNANGSLRTMAEIAEELQSKLGNLNDEAKNDVLKDIFGTDAMRTAIALMQQGAEGLDKVAGAIRRTDAAAQAQERLKGFYGQLENLNGAIETLAIRIGQSGVLEAVTALVTKIADLVDWLSTMSPGLLKVAAIMAVAAASIGPVTLAIGVLTSRFAPLLAIITTRLIPAFALFRLQLVAIATLAGPAQAAIAGIGIAARSAGAALIAAFGGPVGAIIAGVTAVVIGLGYATRDTAASLEELEGTASKASARLTDAREQARLAGVQIANLDQSTTNAAGSVSTLTGALWKSVDAMISVTKNAKIAALATIELENATARKAKSDLEPRLQVMDAAAARNRRLNALLGQNVSGTQDLTEGQRARLDLDRARVKAADAILERNKETAAIIKKLPDYKPTAVSVTPPVEGTMSAPSGEDGSGGRRARGRGASGEDPLERAYREAQDIRSLQIEELRAREQLAATAGDRAVFQNEILALERQSREAEVEEAVRKKELTRQEADTRLAIIKTLYGQSVTEDESGDIIVEKQKSLYGELQAREALRAAEDERATLARAEYDIEREALQHAYSMADTAGERRQIALRMLELDERQQKAILDGILATEDVNSVRYQEAKLLRDALDKQFAERRAAAIRDTESPAERYMRDLNKSPAQLNEAIDQIKIGGLESLNDALVNAIVNFQSLADVAKNVVRSILADLMRLAIQQAIIKPLASAMGLGVPGFASGTNFAPGGLAWVGERGPELVNIPRGSQVIPNHDLAGLTGGARGDRIEFNVNVSGAMSDREARRTGHQIASAASNRMAQARKAGVAG